MRATRGGRLFLVALGLLVACRRPVEEPKHELTGTWLREPELAQGFDLRPDGSLGLLGMSDRSGLAWSASHGELMLSTNAAEHVESTAARLRVAALTAEVLELEGKDEPLAGRYRRGDAAIVRGILTYRERLALPADAHVVVELAQVGVGTIALHAFQARHPVPIGFELSVIPLVETRYEVTARIVDHERTLFVTPKPVPATPDGDTLEILLQRP